MVEKVGMEMLQMEAMEVQVEEQVLINLVTHRVEVLFWEHLTEHIAYNLLIIMVMLVVLMIQEILLEGQVVEQEVEMPVAVAVQEVIVLAHLPCLLKLIQLQLEEVAHRQ